MPYPNFPGVRLNSRSEYGVVAILPNGEERVVGEWTGNPDAAGSAALSAYARYHRGAYVEILCDGVGFAYVTVSPLPRHRPFIREVGFCAHFECGEIPPSECYCAH